MPDERESLRTPEGDVAYVQPQPAASGSARPAQLASYLSAVLDTYDYLEYGDPSQYVERISPGRAVRKARLSEVWVAPLLRRGDDPELGTEATVNHMMQDEQGVVLLLARPGHGKSSLARFLACSYAKEADMPLPILVPLHKLDIGDQSYQEAIVRTGIEAVGLGDDEDLPKLLLDQLESCLVIFDGLDEVPVTDQVGRSAGGKEPTLRRDAAKLIRSFVAGLDRPGVTKAVVTSRVHDYYEDADSRIRDATQYVLGSFSSDQVEEAVDRWHKAAKTLLGEIGGDQTEIVDRSAEIVDLLRGQGDLGVVCQTPLMLNILQTVYARGGELPASVSQLVDRAVRSLIIEKHRGSELGEFVQQNEAWVIAALEQIGFEIHESVLAGRQRAISLSGLRSAVEASAPSGFLTGSYVEQQGLLTKVADHLRRGHGILVPSTMKGEFDFAHNVFREVLAGRALGSRTHRERRKYALDERWHAPIRYWAGSSAGDEAGLNAINTFVGELERGVGSRGAVAALARAEMLAEVCQATNAEDLTGDLSARINTAQRGAIQLLKSDKISFSQRLRASDLLQQLHDPRIDESVVDRVVWIEGGMVTVGRETNHKTRIEKYDNCPASPPISGKLRRFGMSKYSVTNQEFGQFIRAGGYESKAFWPGISYEWASGSGETIEQLLELAREHAPSHFMSEVLGQRLVDSQIPDQCERMVARQRPMYWSDPQFNRPSQPVVGVNWWEARAYCLWLTEHLRENEEIGENAEFCLPTEIEWEWAARLCGDSGVYPWVSGEPMVNAHVRGVDRDLDDLRAFRACAVGSFMFVDSRLPLFDMVGNVWEWTLSTPGRYVPEDFLQEATGNEMSERIARGTSWLSSEQESSEVTFRSFDPPFNAYEDLGFRVVLREGPDG